jgi:hypothetical protein
LNSTPDKRQKRLKALGEEVSEDEDDEEEEDDELD